jgi:hypothetical protein
MPLLFDQYVRRLMGQMKSPLPKEFMKARPHSPQAFQEQQKALLGKGRRGEGVSPRTSQPQVQKGKPQSRIQALLKTGRAQRKGRGAATFSGLPSSAQPQPTFHKSLTMARPGQDPRRDVYGGRRYGGARRKMTGLR